MTDQVPPAMSAEARELLAMVDDIHKRGAFSVVTNLPAAFAKIVGYVQRAELRMFALEESARVHAEILLDAHYGRCRGLTTDQLRTVATAARDDATLRAIGGGNGS